MGTVVSLLYFLLTLGAVTVILFDNGDSGRKIAWILVIALLPAVGLILYLLIGINQRHHWNFQRKHQRSVEAFRTGMDDRVRSLLFDRSAEQRVDEAFRPLVRLLQRPIYPAVTSGNDLEIITEGQRKFELLMQDLETARESIHVEYFHFGADKSSKAIMDMLRRKAREGVKVRFINENIANLPIIPRFYDSMKKDGVEVVRFTNPKDHLLQFATRLNYRDHRKIIVIDGRIGYTGGMNINDHYFLQWRDTHLRLTGPAVASLQYLFLDTWLTSGGRLDLPLTSFFPDIPQKEAARWMEGGRGILRDKLVQVTPDDPSAQWPVLQMSYEWTASQARDYLYLQTPYFVPPEPVLNALKSAAMRGVDVRLMLPAKADNVLMRPVNRSYYQECLDAGIRILLREGPFIHSKTLICDDYLSSIGTANIDYRSFDLDYEVNTYIYDKETALQNKAVFLEDAAISHEVTKEQIARWRWYDLLAQRFLRLFASML